MHYNYSPPLLRHVRLSLIALCISLALLLTCVASAFAATVNIYDNAGVLNSGQIRSQASRLQYPIDIYTTDAFTGSRASFGQQADGKMRGNSLILAVDTVNRYIWVNGSKGVPLSRTQYQDAANSFASEFKSSSDYTNATNSAVRSLQGSLVNATSNTSRERGAGAAPVSGGFSPGGTACCIGLLVLAALVIFGVIRSRRGGAVGGPGGFGGFGGFRGFRRNPPEGPYGPYGQPYNQGQGNYPPPGYGPGYPQQGQGMNPLAAGGLGAAAGGLLGYELGKNAGERDDQGNVGADQGGNYGGGGGADFGGGDYGGGGAGADFGGGDYGSSGGGADFGGGDYGGGGAGADFGGGDYGDSGGSGSDF
ncbi:MAG TPA: hypothetical protein VL485_11465 [Ktedonobacteraceae bacterium]|jgi:hypothetical protein|nr:hypothetical protein [Ktedonobacteraceae bacterium]